MAPEDQEAARLYDAYGPSLYRYALMLLASREAAEDVIQQVFVAMLDRRVRPIEDEERYLRRSVRNACYSALRHRKVRSGPPLDTFLEAASPEAPPVSAEDGIALADALTRLSPEQREVVQLHVFEGRTFKDVADVIGESPNTVASRYRYALDKMKAILTQSRA